MVTPNNDGTSVNPIRYIADTTGVWTGDAGSVIISRNGHPALDINGDDYQHFIGFRIRSTKDAVNWYNSTGGLLQDCEIYEANDTGIYLVYLARQATTTTPAPHPRPRGRPSTRRPTRWWRGMCVMSGRGRTTIA